MVLICQTTGPVKTRRRSSSFSLPRVSLFFFLPLTLRDALILLLIDIKWLMSSAFLSKYHHSEGLKGFNPG